jgi:phage recombination protein Bet
MTHTARQTAVAKQDEAIANNVAKIEQAKRNPTALEMMASRLNISATGLKNTLLSTVFKKASEEEFAALLIVANSYGLNPLTKEIYAFPAKGGGIVPVVSIDGWLRIANEHPMMDGYEFVDLPDADGKIMGIETTIWRKDRTRPIKVVEYLDECKQNTEPWKNMPARMLRHKSFIQAARYAFGFSGIYDPDEATKVADVQLGGDLTPEPLPTRRITAETVERAEPDEETERALDATFDPHTGEVFEEGPADEQRGEAVTLQSAMAEIDACEMVPDVNSRLSALTPHFDEASIGQLRAHAMEKIAELKGGN